VSAPHCRRCRPFSWGRGARPLFGRRARLPALHRGSRQRPCSLKLSPVPRFMVADNRSAPRAASSWQTGDVAGRASFRTARTRSAKPRAGTALAPLFRSHPESALRRASGGASIRCDSVVKHCHRRRDKRLMQRYFLARRFLLPRPRSEANSLKSKNHRAGLRLASLTRQARRRPHVHSPCPLFP